VAYFDELSRHLPYGTGEGHENFSHPRFEMVTCRIGNKGKGKVVPALLLTEHHTMKAYY
jgi:hypothetical protein